MQQVSPFQIYNASAGSGKTFTLVKEYLKILFKSEKREPFKHILAITFTNKAVAEMKERIIDTLKQFSDKTIVSQQNSMFLAICEELEIEALTLHLKSKKLLETILHNYASFDVSTIDGFTHKLVRTFAHDLKLPLNFEVELDQETLLNEAVDSLISKAGIEKKLTKVLVDFAIEKADDDKSWDLSFDFNKIAKLLINENDIPFIETFKEKPIDRIYINAGIYIFSQSILKNDYHLLGHSTPFYNLLEKKVGMGSLHIKYQKLVCPLSLCLYECLQLSYS